jgi:hypothetical protein
VNPGELILVNSASRVETAGPVRRLPEYDILYDDRSMRGSRKRAKMLLRTNSGQLKGIYVQFTGHDLRVL